MQESICLDCSSADDPGGPPGLGGDVPSAVPVTCLCKSRWRTDSECSRADLIRSMRACHMRTGSEHAATLVPPVPVTLASNGGPKAHSRTDSDDSGVVLNSANKRYSNYIEDLDSPRETTALTNSSVNERKTTGQDPPVTPSRLITKDDKLSECEKMFGKLQLYGMAYNFVSRPYIRHILVNSAFNTEETSYKLSLKREPPKR